MLGLAPQNEGMDVPVLYIDRIRRTECLVELFVFLEFLVADAGSDVQTAEAWGIVWGRLTPSPLSIAQTLTLTHVFLPN